MGKHEPPEETREPVVAPPKPADYTKLADTVLAGFPHPGERRLANALKACDRERQEAEERAKRAEEFAGSPTAFTLGLEHDRDKLSAALVSEETFCKHYEALAQRYRDERDAIIEAFRPEPYHGRRYVMCGRCEGQGEVTGRNHDDPKWLPCPSCEGTGIGRESLRAALAAGDKT